MFSRLRRYARTPLRNAREDRLTEALAVTLNAAPDAAAFLVQKIFRELPNLDPFAANTQRTVQSGRIDLELCFGAPHNPELLVWFENKVDSPAYTAQGESYMQELNERPCRSAFVWLLREGEEVSGEPPNEACVLSWQDLAGYLRTWLNSVDQADAAGARGPWIVSQFLDHLEKEEMLAATESLSVADAEALDRVEHARAKLHSLIKFAGEKVQREWGAYSESEIGRLRREKWASADTEAWQGEEISFKYPCFRKGESSPSHDCWWFEINYKRGDAWQTQGESMVLFAGLVLRATDVPSSGFDRLAGHVQGRDFDPPGWIGGSDGWRLLGRCLTVRDWIQLSSDEASEQIQWLADWATKTFTELNDAFVALPSAESGDQ